MWPEVLYKPAKYIEKSVDAKRQRCGSDDAAAARSAHVTGAANKMPRATPLLATGEALSPPPERQDMLYQRLAQGRPWLPLSVKADEHELQTRREPHDTTSKARGTPGAVRKTIAAKATLPGSSTDFLHQQSSDPVTQMRQRSVDTDAAGAGGCVVAQLSPGCSCAALSGRRTPQCSDVPSARLRRRARARAP